MAKHTPLVIVDTTGLSIKVAIIEDTLTDAFLSEAIPPRAIQTAATLTRNMGIVTTTIDQSTAITATTTIQKAAVIGTKIGIARIYTNVS